MSFYGFLNTIWRRERQSSKLIELESDFFERARAYLNHLQTQVEHEEDELIKELFQKRWERATYLVNDLINLRIEKHIEETLDGEFREQKDRKIPYEEKEFRNRLEHLTTNFRESVHGIAEFEEEIAEEYQLIMMKEAENSGFVDTELRTYGPFKPDDIIFLPQINAKNLMQKSKAEMIKIDR